LGVLAIVYGSSDALEIIKNSYKMEVFLSNLKREGVPTLTGNEPPLLIMLAANTAIPIAAASLAAVVVRRWRIESKVWQSEPYDYLVVTIAAAFISLIALVSTDIVIKAVVKPDQYVTQDAPIPTVAFPAKVNPVAPAGQPPADAGNETQMRSPLLGLTGYLPFVLVYALIGFACTVVQGGNVGMPIRRQWRFLLGAATMVAITLLWLDVTSHGSALGARLTPIRNHFSLSNDTLNRLIADITAAYAVVKAMLGAISALVACAVVAYFTRRDVSESSEVDRLVTEVDAAYGEQATENGAQRGQASPRGTSKPDLKEFKEWVLSVNKDISNLSPAEASRFSNRRSDISAAIGAYVRNLTMRDPTARDQVERDQAETKTDNRLEIVLANLKDQPCEAWARQTIQFEGLKTVRIGKGDTEVRFRVATKTPSDDQWKNDSLNVAGSEEVEVEWRTSDKPDTTTTAKLAIDDICGIFMAKTSSSVEPPSHPQEPPPVHPQQPPEREVVVAEIQPNIKEAANLMRAGEGRRP
jgi:hypothetical protein